MLKQQLVVLCALGLAACGGGGGGGDSLKVRFTAVAVSKAYYEWDFPLGEQPPVSFNIEASITGGTRAPTVYVSLLDLNGWLTPGTAFQEIGPDIYEVGVALPGEFQAGVHTGMLEVKLCSDPACSKVLTSDTLPYTVTLKVNPTMTVAATAPVAGKSLITAGGVNAAFAVTLPEFSLVAAGVPTEFRSYFYVRVDDPDGRLQLSNGNGAWYYFSAMPSGGKFAMDFSLLKQLGPGEHSGALSVRVCRDEYCLRPYTGSASVPYQVSVASSFATPLAPVEGVPEWQDPLGGNSAHNAHVPMTVDAAALSPRWLYQLGSGSYNFAHELVTSGGRVFARSSGEVRAVNENDGSLAWQKSLGGYDAPLLVANEALYVRSSSPGAPTLMYKLDPATGSTLFVVEQDVDGASAPLSILNGNVLTTDWVYTNSQPNYDEEFNLYDGQTGAKLAVPPCLRDLEAGQKSNGLLRLSRGPAIDGGTAYLFSGAGLEIVDFDGQTCTSKPYWDMSASSDPVLASNGYVLRQSCGYSGSEVLHGVPTSGSAWPWSAPTLLCRGAATADGVVYSSKAWWEGLEARDADNGALLWTWLDERIGMYGGSVLATDNMLFVSAGRTYAFDLATRRPVWSINVPGNAMALSPGGVLYLLNGTSIVAVNVRP